MCVDRGISANSQGNQNNGISRYHIGIRKVLPALNILNVLTIKITYIMINTLTTGHQCGQALPFFSHSGLLALLCLLTILDMEFLLSRNTGMS